MNIKYFAERFGMFMFTLLMSFAVLSCVCNVGYCSKGSEVVIQHARKYWRLIDWANDGSFFLEHVRPNGTVDVALCDRNGVSQILNLGIHDYAFQVNFWGSPMHKDFTIEDLDSDFAEGISLLLKGDQKGKKARQVSVKSGKVGEFKGAKFMYSDRVVHLSPNGALVSADGRPLWGSFSNENDDVYRDDNSAYETQDDAFGFLGVPKNEKNLLDEGATGNRRGGKCKVQCSKTDANVGNLKTDANVGNSSQLDVDRSVVSVKNEAIADDKSSNWFLSESNAGSLKQVLSEEKSFSKMLVHDFQPEYNASLSRNVRESAIPEQDSMIVKCSGVLAPHLSRCCPSGSNVLNEALRKESEELLPAFVNSVSTGESSEATSLIVDPADSDRMKALASIPHINLGGEKFVLADERIIIDAKETKSSDDSLLTSADVIEQQGIGRTASMKRGFYLVVQPSNIEVVAWQSCYCTLPEKFCGSWRMEIPFVSRK